MADDLGTAGMPALLMQAAQQAAQADGVLDPQHAALQQARNAMAVVAAANSRQQQQQQQQQQAKPSKKKGPPLRRGKWTPEEEAYAARLIQEFKAGLLPLTDGTTLRTFLSKLLNCDPMRISKKFVGSNCIGKQVFRRRTADLNRLTPEQIQQSRAELSDLERRFLERVAQTNRVKSSGCVVVAAPLPPPNNNTAAASQEMDRDMMSGIGGGGGADHFQLPTNQQQQQQLHQEASNPPWLQPPLGYRHGAGQAFAANHLSSANARAAAAGRALLGASAVSAAAASKFQNATTDQLAAAAQQGGSTGLLAMAELQRRASHSSLLQSALQQQNASASNLLAAAVRNGSNSALQQIARNASAHRLAGQLGGVANNSSMNSLMLKTGLSRDQLSQLARERGLSSSGSLSNMIQRQNSFDALMSLDFQSLQSIDNLANLIQTGGTGSNMPQSGMKNADFGAVLSAANSRGNLNAAASSEDFSNAARRLASAASANRMDALLRNLSGNNMGREGDTSNATLSNLLQSMQANLNQFGGQDNSVSSTASLFNQNGGGSNSMSANQSAMNFASFLRPDSSTGLSALRMQDGLNQRNSSSVDDFLSLVAAGDIPHQDPNLLNVPLMQQQDAAAKLLAQQQLLQQVSGNSDLANAFASRSFGNMAAAASNNNFSNSQLSNSASAAALAMLQARAAAAGNAARSNKRTMDFMSGDRTGQGGPKR